ncbi:class I SAM-dependent methyltransferase [bacterium]|nr:class I SAM-dependent methyltransferase [bacterium]
MVELSGRQEDALQRYREEVLRWNASINLISRIDTRELLESLVTECVAAYNTLVTAVLPAVAESAPDRPTSCHYADLGSGAGFPGLVWHLLSEASGGMDESAAGAILVEPREKRAWFLEQTAALMDLRDVRVGMDQWGARTGLRGAGLPATVTGLISLKALRLTDDEVIAGWRRYRGGAPVDTLVICRFQGPDGTMDTGLRERLRLPPESPPESQGAPWARFFPIDTLPEPRHLLVSGYPSI